MAVVHISSKPLRLPAQSPVAHVPRSRTRRRSLRLLAQSFLDPASLQMASTTEPRLHSRSAVIGIEVDDLFGLYSYRLGGPDASPEDLSRLLILYGDNGSGKTTILRLVYHMLSKEDDQGHRSYIARVPFRRFL